MNWLVYHIASGHVFFSGLFFVAVAALASIRDHPIVGRVYPLAFLIGIGAVAISSTAIPYVCYLVALATAAVWIVSRYLKKWQSWAAVCLMAICLLCAALEIPYHVTPTLEPTSVRRLAIIGDSVTAGMGDSDRSVKWPTLLARQHDLEIQDVSHMGATAASALRRAKELDITSPVVILEIGGNDLLGGTPSRQFSRDLDALLALVATPNRQVLMFELPLPPFRHEYGRVQRSLARKYRVSLVPKRVFLSILAADDSTLDTIHLTQTGHDRMALCMWRLVRSAFTSGDPPYSTPDQGVGRMEFAPHATLLSQTSFSRTIEVDGTLSESL